MWHIIQIDELPASIDNTSGRLLSDLGSDDGSSLEGISAVVSVRLTTLFRTVRLECRPAWELHATETVNTRFLDIITRNTGVRHIGRSAGSEYNRNAKGCVVETGP
jgi:hypothetical protein